MGYTHPTQRRFVGVFCVSFMLTLRAEYVYSRAMFAIIVFSALFLYLSGTLLARSPLRAALRPLLRRAR